VRKSVQESLQFSNEIFCDKALLGYELWDFMFQSSLQGQLGHQFWKYCIGRYPQHWRGSQNFASFWTAANLPNGCKYLKIKEIGPAVLFFDIWVCNALRQLDWAIHSNRIGALELLRRFCNLRRAIRGVRSQQRRPMQKRMGPVSFGTPTTVEHLSFYVFLNFRCPGWIVGRTWEGNVGSENSNLDDS